MDELEQVFPPSYFEQLSPAERERRESLLADIAERIHRDGPHTARPDPTRARQFMPFAALKGYHDLAYEREEAEGDNFLSSYGTMGAAPGGSGYHRGRGRPGAG